MDSFVLCMPMDILKSSGAAQSEMRIGGIASTADTDRDGDKIIQRGLDIQEFVDSGWFNYDHDNTKILGYPDKSKCEVTPRGLYVEGVLLKGVPLAESVYQTAIALQQSNAPRKMGFSVEGKVTEKDALGRIVKAKIYNVAITANPVNTNCTWDVLRKSFVDPETVDKALTAGHGDSNGSVLIPEDLEHALKVLTYAIGDDDVAKSHMQALEEALRKNKDGLTKSQYTLYLQVAKGYSREQAANFADIIWKE